MTSAKGAGSAKGVASAKGAAVALAAVLAASGCQIGGRVINDERAPESAPVKAGAAPPAAPEQKLGSRETSDQSVRIRVTLTSLARQQNLVTLNFTASALSIADTSSWQVAGFFGDTSGPDGISGAVNGVYLIDGKNKKKHIVASDSNKRCVCTSNLSATFVKPGQSVVLSATFAAPPRDVNAIDVHIPHAGTFRNVPIS